MRAKVLLVAVVLAAGLCLVPPLGYGEVQTDIEIRLDKLEAQVRALEYRIDELEKAINSLIEHERGEPKKQETMKQRVIKSWQGTGIKTTEPFEIKGELWCVKWENKGSFLQIYVYRTSGERVGIYASVTERGRDTYTLR